MKTYIIITAVLSIATSSYCQHSMAPIETQDLSPLVIEGVSPPKDIQRLEPIQGTFIYSGKKNEVIVLSEKTVAMTEKYGRQIFAKIPGVFVYDMDGTGNQMNIAARGLDPHRSWEFNVRKDGILTNSDMYGYPASHYNIPLEAVERIELVRGTASLQYGAQFGGMINYISKQPDTSRTVAFESINTVGSYGLLSTYNAASGTVGKFRYSAWFNKKTIEGFRENSASTSDAQAISLFYEARKNLHFKLEWTHSNYLVQLPGALTDSMFHADATTSTRARNFYNPNIHIPSVTINWNATPKTLLQLTTSAVLGSRNSVMFDQPANIADTIVGATLQYNHRQVDIDQFNSYTAELRMLRSCSFLSNSNAFSAGVQYMNNDMHRRQQGKGTTGSDFDLTLVSPTWGRDLHFRTHNIAAFMENHCVITNKFSLNTSVRWEFGQSTKTGFIPQFSDSVAIPNKIRRFFPLFAFSGQYDISDKMSLYGGWSRAYRPVIFKDIIPQSVYEVADPKLKDANGYNAELGFRGKWKFLQWDLTAFYLQYNDRVGTIAQTDEENNLVIFRTNIGDSRTMGLEMFVQGDFSLGNKTAVSLFTSSSFMDARYQKMSIRTNESNIQADGNKVEGVPAWISRNGVVLKHSIMSVSILYSFTSESFADALNTIEPSANGATGLVPSYQLLDLNFAVQLTEKLKLQINANNILDAQYFTKRPQFYPGPGIWPSDGRTFSATVLIKI